MCIHIYITIEFDCETQVIWEVMAPSLKETCKEPREDTPKQRELDEKD